MKPIYLALLSSFLENKITAGTFINIFHTVFDNDAPKTDREANILNNLWDAVDHYSPEPSERFDVSESELRWQAEVASILLERLPN